MKRQQLLDRIDYDFNDRIDCMDKSDWKCSRCGTALKLGANATLDHFIPISKGGMNQKINIIPLCEDCNHRKTNKIVSPDWYLHFLREKHQKEIQDYFDSYIKSFEYLSRRNILACDMYEMQMYIGPEIVTKNKQRAKQIRAIGTKRFLMERVYEGEFTELETFFIKYLQRYNELYSEDWAHKQLEFWLRFGSVYVIRSQETNEIKAMIPVLLRRYHTGRHCLFLYAFSMYKTDISANLVTRIPFFFAERICTEQKLPYLRIEMMVLKKDGASRFLHDELAWYDWNGNWLFGKCRFNSPDYKEEPDDEKEDTMPFYQAFGNIKEKMDEFFSKKGYECIRWIGRDIIPDYEPVAEDPADPKTQSTLDQTSD